MITTEIIVTAITETKIYINVPDENFVENSALKSDETGLHFLAEMYDGDIFEVGKTYWLTYNPA